MQAKAARLVEELHSPDPAVVTAAVRSLSARGLFREEITAAFARLLWEHPDPSVRAQACKALGRMGTRTGRDALAEASSDPDLELRAQALAALDKLDSR